MEESHKRRTLPAGDGHFDKAPLPKVIADYRIESLLEEGGMSRVYLATNSTNGELVTLKVLSSKYIDNEDVKKRFLKESQIIAMADHPNIVKLFGQGDWEGGLYLAMEYIPGISLHELLKTTPLSLKRALEIALEIAYALCHFHSFGVIHRDLKPENVLMTRDGHIKVIDFGIAQVLHEEGENAGKKRIIGTPVYMSPEQQRDPESVTYASDIYSLGIILYELITGKLSHGKVHLSLVPKQLRQTLTKCFHPEPQKRYQDVVDLIADLSSFMNEANEQQVDQPAALLESIFHEIHEARSTLMNIESSGATLEEFESATSAGHVLHLINRPEGELLLLVRAEGSRVKGLIANLHLRYILEAIDLKTLSPEKILRNFNSALQEKELQARLSLLLRTENSVSFFDKGYGTLLIERENAVQSIPGKELLLPTTEESLTLKTCPAADRLFFTRFNKPVTELEQLLQEAWQRESSPLTYLKEKILTVYELDSLFLAELS